ncbi:MAG: PAS domain-containing sensor histidine kinase [Thermodesulfobacteriota bacterium]
MRDTVDTHDQNPGDLAAVTDPEGNIVHIGRLAGRILGIQGTTSNGNDLLLKAASVNRHGFDRVMVYRDANGGVSRLSFHLSGDGWQRWSGAGQPQDPEQLQALIEASKAILAADSVDSLLEKTLESACILTGCRVSAFCKAPETPGENHKIIKYRASNNPADGRLGAALRQAAKMLEYPPFQQILENQEKIRLIEAASFNPKKQQAADSENEASCDTIFARMKDRQNITLGVLLARDQYKAEFSRQEEELLSELVAYASIGLERFQASRIPDHMNVEMDQVFSALAEAVIVYDKTGAPVTANPAALEMLGFDPVGMSGEEFASRKSLLYPDERRVTFENLPCRRAIAGQTIKGETYLRRDATGSTAIYEFNAVPLMRDNRIAGAVTVARNESERNRLLDQLETERTALQAIISNAPEAIVVVDEECSVVMTNPAAKRLYRQSSEAGRHRAAEAWPEDTPYDPVDLPLARSVFRGEVIVDHELTTCSPGDEDRHILVNTAPIRNPEGKITGAVGVFHDITQRKRERLELRRARDELEKRVEERTRELRTLSLRMLETLESDRQKIAKELHDSLGASLAAIKFSLEEKLSQMPPDPPDKVMSLENIVSYLTGTIKETKRISATLRPTILDDLGLLATITWFCREFNSFYKGIRIVEKIKIQEEGIEEPLKIVIYRIMQEAMNNAAKHGRPETIVLSLQKRGERIELEIKDDGSGFDPQSRLNSNDPMSGHGIQGMRERARVCGGDFLIESEPGQGTKLSVSFPGTYCSDRS